MKENSEFTITDGVLIKYNGEVKSLVIPEEVVSIGEGAFGHCDSLISITIPKSVTYIGDEAFKFCSHLTEISVDEDNEKYCSHNGLLYSKDMTRLIACPRGKSGNLSIPEGVCSIGAEAFSWCDYLASVAIPEGVTSIGYRAFFICDNLTSITVPNSVTYIGGEAFSGCDSLAEISVGKDNENYCSQDGVLYSKDMTRLIMCPCGKSGALTIPDGVAAIGEWAFWDCVKLTSITIPKSVTFIGAEAFRGCNSLTEKSVGKDNEQYCSQDGVLYSRDMTRLITCPCGKSGALSIPDGVTCIGDWAFWGCWAVTDIIIPDSVTAIGEEAFGGCTSLERAMYKGNTYSHYTIDELYKAVNG